jgi:hypothetical protein
MVQTRSSNSNQPPAEDIDIDEIIEENQGRSETENEVLFEEEEISNFDPVSNQNRLNSNENQVNTSSSRNRGTTSIKSKNQRFREIIEAYLPIAPEGLYDDHFDVTSPAGQKLFKAATVFKIDDKDRMTLETKNKDKAVKLLKKLSDEFCWGLLLDDFPKADCNILMKPKLATLTEVRVASAAYWSPNSSDPSSETEVEDLTQDILNEDDAARSRSAVKAYFCRIRSTMIAKAIFAHFDRSDLDALIKRNSKYIQWNDAHHKSIKKIDGPSLLKAILDKLTPGTVGQIAALRQRAKDIKLSNFDNDVNDMITELVTIKGQIDDLGGTFDDYMNVCFTALLSGPDKSFNNLISAKQSEYYMGSLTEPSELLAYAEANYNNLVSTGKWAKQDNNSKAIIAALASELKMLKTVLLTAATNRSKDNNNNGAGGFQIADWRYTKQPGADSVEKDGKVYHWCPKHKGKNGEVTGLYVTHKPEDHDSWLEQKKQNNSRRRQNRSKPDASIADKKQGAQAGGERLKLDENLKAALVSGQLLSSIFEDDESVN